MIIPQACLAHVFELLQQPDVSCIEFFLSRKEAPVHLVHKESYEKRVATNLAFTNIIKM